MGDWILGEELVDLDELRRVVSWARRRRGVVQARHVLPWLRRGAESAQESRLRWILVQAGFPEPAINPEIVLPDGRLVRLDLAYEALRIGCEYDGDWHIHTRSHDGERRRLLADAGWKILVATKDDLSEPGRLLREVNQAMAERRRRGKHRW